MIAPRRARFKRPGLGAAAPLLYVAARGLVLAALIPPWQGPDEPGHVELALGLASPGSSVAAREEAILGSMAAHDFWRLSGLSAPVSVTGTVLAAPPRRFDDVPGWAGEESQRGDETVLGYLPLAAALVGAPRAAADPAAALLRMRRVSVALTVLLALLAARAARAAVGARAAPAATLAAVGAPMVGFAGAVASPDAAAAALAAGWFALLGATLARPTARRGAGLVALAVLAAAAKRTALYLVAALPLALWAVWDAAGRPRPRPGRRGAVGAALAALALAAGAAWPLPAAPEGWAAVGAPTAAVRDRAAARTGAWGWRVVDDRPDAWRYAARWRAARGGEAAAARAWLRAPDGGRASLALSDDAGTWSATEVDLPPGAWRAVDVAARLAPGARAARLAVVPGQGTPGGVGAVDVDDVAWTIGERDVSPGGAERPLRLGRALVRRAARYADLARVARAAGPALGAPAPSAARSWRGLRFTSDSFWGGFGWLTLWSPAAHRALGGALAAGALGAALLALVAPRRLVAAGAEASATRLLRVCGAAAWLALAVALVGGLAGTGADKLPQGRYLVAAVVPLALPAAALAERVAARLGAPPGRGAAALAAAVVALDAWAVGLVLWPAYR